MVSGICQSCCKNKRMSINVISLTIFSNMSWFSSSYCYSYLINAFLPLKTVTLRRPLLWWQFLKIYVKKNKKYNLANLVPALWVASTLPPSRCCFLVLIWYSNFEILVCFIWSLHPSRGQLNTWKSWPFAPKWGGQRKGKWEFAPHASGVSVLICHNATLE